ncbi:MAG TPA: flavodoxin domain-containing protein [Tepidiformaceae bacterium]|nr:flavodoxin domain-containing protein [Tepidiformaceae bacterium]
MKVLIAVASRHGATREIGEAIGRTLTEKGHAVTVAEAGENLRADGYDAVIVGSGIYAGHWLDGARDFEKANRGYLARLPVWLFSSGPIGDPPIPANGSVAIDDIIEQTQPVDHRLFAGKLDRRRLRWSERALTVALRAPEGDFRAWAGIEAWAEGIAEVLNSGWGGSMAS